MIKGTLTLRRAIVLVVVFSLLGPALMISGYSWFKRYDEDVQKRTQELLQQNADILSNGMQEPLWNINTESGTALLDAMMMRNEDIIRIEVRDTALGVFVAGERSERRTGYTASAEKPVTYRGNTIGSVQLEVGSTRLRKIMIEGLVQQMTALAAQVVISIALILILLEKRLVGPLQRLGKGAERLAGKQLDAPFTWARLDEIGLLSRRLEDTRLSLRKLFEELDRKNLELEQDIDKRKRIQQELHERETRFRALVEQSPIAIIELDKSYRVIEWNAAAEQIFGYTREQAIGQHTDFISPESEREALRKHLHSLTAGTGGMHSISNNLTADGRIIICQWSNTHIDDESGHTGRILSMAEDISEKRRTEEAQRLSEAKFSGAFQCNPDSVSITRLSDGAFLDVNQTFVKSTGFSRDELFGKSADELNMWVDPMQRRQLTGQLGMNKMVRDFAWNMRTKAGEIRQCLTNATLFNVGPVQYMLAVIRDVTDQRLMEEQKTEADRVLLRLAQGAPYEGEAFFASLVADLAAALRTDMAFISLREDNMPDRARSLNVYSKGHADDNFEYVIKGTPCEFPLAGELSVFQSGIQARFPDDHALVEMGMDSYAGAPLRDPAGRTIGVLAVMHSQPLVNPDLVKSLLQVFSERASAELERMRAEEALRVSEQRFSAIFHTSPVALCVTSCAENYAIKDINHAFERLFLRQRETVLGKNTQELSLYCDVERDALIETFERTGHHDRLEIWMYRGDGNKILVQMSENTFSLSKEKFTIMACEDITEKRHIENEIRELNANLEERVTVRTNELQLANRELADTLQTLNVAQEELVRSEKLAALGSLVAGVAHELNTPIGNSLMVASTLVDHTRTIHNNYLHGNGLKRSALENYIGDASKAGDILVRNLHRAAHLVTSFKQVAMDQTSSQRRTFSLGEVVSEIVLTLWPTFKKTAFKVEQQIPEDLTMDSYPGPLGQVVANLMNNALLHAFEGRDTGTVTIAAQAAGDGWAELMVKDDGAGIPPANLNRIFDPFFTTKLGAGGSGLGLNITHNIVTGILGGKIRVQSELGVGTTFILTLPAIAPKQRTEEHQSAEA